MPQSKKLCFHNNHLDLQKQLYKKTNINDLMASERKKRKAYYPVAKRIAEGKIDWDTRIKRAGETTQRSL